MFSYFYMLALRQCYLLLVTIIYILTKLCALLCRIIKTRPLVMAGARHWSEIRPLSGSR